VSDQLHAPTRSILGKRNQVPTEYEAKLRSRHMLKNPVVISVEITDMPCIVNWMEKYCCEDTFIYKIPIHMVIVHFGRMF
jgi:hypothetical protein